MLNLTILETELAILLEYLSTAKVCCALCEHVCLWMLVPIPVGMCVCASACTMKGTKSANPRRKRSCWRMAGWLIGQ